MKKLGEKLGKKGKIILCCCIAAAILAIIAVVVVIVVPKKEEVAPKKHDAALIKDQDEPKKEVEKIKIVDMESNTRPYAVMINNINEARVVQSGLQQAYMVYEIQVEGGITRLLALYKDANVDALGSIRSARHYYLDYAMENDAIYVHWGWSPQAQEDIPKLGINNLNGLYDQGFYRITNAPVVIATEHTGFTNTDKIKAAAEGRGYRMTTEEKPLLSYSAKPVDYTDQKSSSDATKVVLTYSNYTEVTYEYDEEAKVYKRYNRNNQKSIDYPTGKQITTKNIIAYQVNMYGIANDVKGRLMMDNIGSGTGYYISEGKVVDIKWSKKDRASKTKYTLEDGTELVVNDGNTFIQILPTSGSIKVK